MTVEREFAGFVLPFATGIFLTTGPSLIRLALHPSLCMAPLALTAAFLLCMMHPYRRRISLKSSYFLLAMIGLAAGTFTGLTSSLAAISSNGSPLVGWASGFGFHLGESIDGVPFGSELTNGILKALITGEREDIPRNVTESFRQSGASHILSLSGFHLGIIYAIVKQTLSGIGNSIDSRRLRSIIIIIICGFYTLATGAGPSIVRAFIFIALGEAASILHRRRSTAGILISAMMIQLTISPQSIRSAGFQLSYAAMAGIAWIYPILKNFWPGTPENDRILIKCVRRVWNSAALSISCQLTTGPLAYLYFESFPAHFLLTNIISLPLVSIIIPLGLTSTILSVAGLCPDIMFKATDMLIEALTAALEIISQM